MRSIRAKSLLIDFLLTPIPFPHRDNARSPVARCMGYDDQTPIEQAQGDEPLLSVGEAIIFERNARPSKHLLGIREAKAMLGEVLPVLRLVPFVCHSRFKVDCSSFCSYAQGPRFTFPLTPAR